MPAAAGVPPGAKGARGGGGGAARRHWQLIAPQTSPPTLASSCWLGGTKVRVEQGRHCTCTLEERPPWRIGSGWWPGLAFGFCS